MRSVGLKPTAQASSKLNLLLAIVGLIVVLVAVNLSIKKYETHLATAEKVLLQLAPVDPRSLMQGDYMALNYAISEQIMAAIEQQLVPTEDQQPIEELYNLSQDGLVVIRKDAQGVGHFVRLVSPSEEDQLSLAKEELLLAYRLRQGQLKIATNAFFFQEGQAAAFEQAKYGLFRVNDKGEPLLTDMVNSDFEVIDPE
ncbi:GDYXXLXY domain-containing protein [Psychrobacter sp. UBA3962]|uniref:GDYXXLXY domain-containing protein n=1 Tax=Psychrobacter sp. UBA3962 TaxID=1947352 RepID=UPI0025E91D95|nr:GDYXXLXY domain-containing protein [Psychrobacter sp. UBA3962]